MNKNIEIITKKECTGCGVCVVNCPKKCISMVYDDEGFLYPNINQSDCINCGLCVQTCQVVNKLSLKSNLCSYGVIGKNSDILQHSSSGALFSTLANYFIEDLKGYIVGCIMDEEGNVFHQITNEQKNIYNMCGSKYVQSTVEHVYLKVKKLLNDNQYVLFTGTPCEIAGLYNFLKRDYDTLLTIDLICHGTPSPLQWKKEYQLLKKKYNFDEIKFRYKDKFNKTEYALSLFSNRKLVKRIYWPRNGFYSLFIKSKNLRLSCYFCPFSTNKRIGNMTMGDLGSSKVYSNFFPYLATSCLFINDKKGELFWKKTKKLFEYIEIDHKIEEHNNLALIKPESIKKRLSSQELQECIKNPEYLKKYRINLSLKAIIKLFIKQLVPVKTREYIKSFIRGG
ncbi:Coenzyme F420 hydrogenase/dehydrogenase, beta subunit C-terminal domain [Thomasclavelia spiroformis]|uniref:Coenzyme F420 hydrogenase/dehydrogenase, beta subunit C-terminal domain n=1 Tax=Thomasclavelia spiroformis TaxID=29348 RepID=UPI0024B20DB1|nr:Coenzyme F420 hydrogenase/dehydrogenase, beta subunit C-terminal domain [Thomasclavelia spiroformis]